MSEKKEIKDLTLIEIMEDLNYYIDYMQLQAPSFLDKTFVIVRKYTKELEERFNNMDKRKCWECGNDMMEIWSEERGTEAWICPICGRGFINPKYLEREEEKKNV